MGQCQGKSSLHQAAVPYVNLSPSQIRALWTAFSLNAEGWGISSSLFVAILAAAKVQGGQASDQGKAKAFFDLLDTDKNDIIDGLEMMATLVSRESRSTSAPNPQAHNFVCFFANQPHRLPPPPPPLPPNYPPPDPDSPDSPNNLT